MAEAKEWMSEFTVLLVLHENGAWETYEESYGALVAFIEGIERKARLAGFDEAVKCVPEGIVGKEWIEEFGLPHSQGRNYERMVMRADLKKKRHELEKGDA